MFRSRRITFYVLRELIGPTFLGLFIYTFVLLMNHFFIVAEATVAKNLGLELTLRMFLTGIPGLLVLSIPMTVLLASLITVGRLSADHEWVALQAAGHGPSKLVVPLLIYGLLASGVSFFVLNWAVPESTYAMRSVRGEMLYASNLASDLRPRVWYSDKLDGVVLFVDEIRAGTEGKLQGVLVVREEGGRTALVLAEEGDLYPAPDRSAKLVLDLKDAVRHEFDPRDVETYRIVTWDHFRDELPLPAYATAFLGPVDKAVPDLKPRELLGELREARSELDRVEADRASGVKKRGAQPVLARARWVRAEVELHHRIALPLASLVYAVLAVPLGSARVRSGKGAGFALSLFLILIYWITYTFFRDQAAVDKFPTALGPWMANLVLVPWAAWGLWRMRRPQSARGGLLSQLLGLGIRIGRLVRRRVGPGESPSASENGDAEDPLADLGGTANRFIGRLDQYIGLQYLKVVAVSLFAAYLIYGLVESKNLIERLIQRQQGYGLLLEYFKYFAPGKLPLVLPLACLIGSVVAFTLLSRTGELTAIKATGVSMRRATFPVLLLTAVMSLLLLVVSDSIAPAANRRAQEVRDRIAGRPPRTHGLPKTGSWNFGSEQRRLYHYRYYNEEREEFHDMRVMTIDRASRRVIDHRYAPRARWIGEDRWRLDGGWHIEFSPDGRSAVRTETFEGPVEISLEKPRELAQRAGGALRSRTTALSQQLTLEEISSRIEALAAKGYDVTTLRVAYHGKLAQAVTPMVMVLLGLPFAFRVGKRGSLYGIGVAFLLVLVYWTVFAVFNAMGLETLLDPVLAAWAPNVLFSLLGSYLLLYVPT